MFKLLLLVIFAVPAFAVPLNSDYWRCERQAPLLYPSDIKDLHTCLDEALANDPNYGPKFFEVLKRRLYLKGLETLTSAQEADLAARAPHLSAGQVFDLIAAEELGLLCPPR